MENNKPVFSRDKLCIFNLHYDSFFSLEYFAKSMEEFGISSVELIAGHPSLYIDHKEIQDLTEIKALLKQHHLNVMAVSAQSCRFRYQYAAKEDNIREDTYNFFLNGIRVASELGAGILQSNSGWGYWNESPSEGKKRAADMLERLGRQGEKYGVSLAVEAFRPQESLIGYRAEDVKEILDMADHPHVKAMIDTCAMSVAGETIQHWFDLFGTQNIIHTHFIDAAPYGHLVWGEGKRNLEEDLAVFEKNGYTGVFSQELTDASYYQDPYGCDKRNLEQLNKFFV